MLFEINQDLLDDKHTVVFYNKNPIFDVLSIDGYVDEAVGISSTAKISREFSFSTDNFNWSPYAKLLDESLKALPIKSFLFLRFKYTRTGVAADDPITVVKFELKTTNKDAKVLCGHKPTVVHIQNPDLNPLCTIANMQFPDIDINNTILCNPDTGFDPYAMLKGFNMQNQLNFFINKSIGVEVRYFRTDPDVDTVDSFLKEYSLRNTVESKCLRIMLPKGNELPDAKPTYDEWDGMGFNDFEVQVDKAYFESIFGAGVKPRDEDYIHLVLANKMFYVHSNFLEIGVNGKNTYWTLTLKDVANLKDKNTKEYIDSITVTHKELFEEVEAEEMEDIANSQQNHRLTANRDDIREHIDSDVIIEKSQLLNNGSVFSEFHYDFSQMDAGVVAVRYIKKLNISDQKNFTFTNWFNLVAIDIVIPEFNIIEVTRIDRYFVNLKLDKFVSDCQLEKNDYIGITMGNNIYNIVNVIDDHTIQIITQEENIDTNFTYKKLTKNTIAKSIENNMGIRIDMVDTKCIIVNINRKYFRFDIPALIIDNWYGFVFSVSQDFALLTMNIYQMIDQSAGSDKPSTRLDQIYKSSRQFSIDIIDSNKPNTVELISSNMLMTNFRLWDHVVREDSHSIILTSKFVRNASKAIIIDNANENLNYPTIGTQI